MNATLFPATQDLGLQDITHYHMPDAASERDLHALAELAAFTCNCPVAIISFAGLSKQWVFATGASSFYQLPVHEIFLPTALCQGEVLIVTDVINDQRVSVQHATANYSDIRFYAGTPIISSAGAVAGSLFVLDTSLRDDFTREQQASLKSIAQLAVRLLELNVTNRVVIKQAEELIEEEKKMTRLVIAEQEAEKGFIAHKLQESFAQTLAATKIYLEFADQSPDSKDHFIKKGLENLSGVIDEIKHLCNTMVPTTLGNANPVELLDDMVADWEARNNIFIDFICGTSLQGINTQTGLAIFRIVQQQLKLASYCNATKAEISILEKDGIAIYFSMKDMNFADADPQKESFIKNINTRVGMINGQMTMDSSLSENDVMVVNIPRQ